VVDNDIVDGSDGAVQVFDDGDGDGFGADESSSKWMCLTDPDFGDFATEVGDCDDTDDGIFPGAPELCDGVDQDCNEDGDVGLLADDEGTAWVWDGDRDTYVPDNALVEVACDPPTPLDEDGQWVDLERAPEEEDCDDLEASVHPGAEEICDELGIDEDCNPDTEADIETWWVDADDDGAPVAVEACDEPDAVVPAGSGPTDCDDADGNVFPGAPELCDGLDNDCDEQVDEEPPTWVLDGDGDGYPGGGAAVEQCEPPAEGWVPEVPGASVDCDDGDAQVFPGQLEVCNSIDDDCDGDRDETVGEDLDGAVQVWPDLDADGFGAADAEGSWVCSSQVERFTAPNDADCDDGDPAIRPTADELVGNEVDENCDGFVGDQWAGGGGGCQSVPSPSLGWLALPLLMGLRRRTS
jgi:hypothetical protein